MADPSTYRKTSADKSKAVYSAGREATEMNTGPITDKDEVERRRAAYDAEVVNSGARSAASRGGTRVSGTFKMNAPNMPRRAVPAKSEMDPKPPSTPY